MLRVRRREDDRAEIGERHFKDRERGQKPRIMGHLLKMESHKLDFSLELPEIQPADTLILTS